MDVKVEFEGIGKFKKALKSVADDLPRELQAEFKEVAVFIAGQIASVVPRGESGKARASVKPRATQTGASIRAGGASAPYMPWLDYGGKVGRNKSIVRPFISTGRYVYPTILGEREVIESAAEHAIVSVAKKAGFESHE